MIYTEKELYDLILPMAESTPKGSERALVATILEIIEQDREAHAKLPRVTDGTLYPLLWTKLNGYRTGQEWYDRFVEEYSKLEGQPTGGTMMPRYNAVIAAKKAGGL